VPRRFTHAEAERLRPRIGELLARAVELKAAYQQAGQAFQAITTRIMLLGGIAVDRAEAAAARDRRDRAANELKAAVESIHETGYIIKDLDMGLVDFPTTYQGREVYLCWKLGEPSIAWWHGIDEGFAGRKPIDREFLKNHSA
jgi:hypothetical protein